VVASWWWIQGEWTQAQPLQQQVLPRL
jgi:hypothetical protein